MLALAIEFTGDPVGLASSADSAVAAPRGRRRRKRRFGGHSGGETPGPIPNPEVKPSSADGTALETGWESRSPPRLLTTGPPHGRSCSLLARLNRRWRRASPRYAGMVMPRALQPRPRRGPRRRPAQEGGLPRGVVEDIRRSARPGQSDE